MKNRNKKRIRAYKSGHRAEWAAALFLMARGYRVLARRYKTPVGEVDIVASNKKRLAFIEVKGRVQLNQALRAVTPCQQRRIKRAATHWMAKHAFAPVLEIGFDVIAITPWKFPRHYINVFSHTPY